MAIQPEVRDVSSGVQLAEVVAAMSRAVDLAAGQPLDHSGVGSPGWERLAFAADVITAWKS